MEKRLYGQFKAYRPRKHGGGLKTSEKAREVARRRWDATPIRGCEVCGREHRCVYVEVGDVEEGVRELVRLFEESVRRIVRERAQEGEKQPEEG